MNNYYITIQGEPDIVTKSRFKILDTFKDLVFEEDGHKYFLNGKSLPSVSAVTHAFAPEFEAEKQAKKYAKKNGGTAEYWLDVWKYNNLKATISGTEVHLFGEVWGWLKNGHPELLDPHLKHQYIQDKNWLVPILPKEEAILRFYQELPKTDYLVLSETKVYSDVNPALPKLKQQYCGTFDILFYREDPLNPENSGFIIRDFKTNKELYKEYNRTHNKTMLTPFLELPDEPLSAYILQLSCYQIPLEDIGLKVIDREVVWLKDDATYQLIKLPDYTKKLREIL